MDSASVGFVAAAPLCLGGRAAPARLPLRRAADGGRGLALAPRRRARAGVIAALGGGGGGGAEKEPAEGEAAETVGEVTAEGDEAGGEAGAEAGGEAAEGAEGAGAEEVGSEDILSSPVFLKKKLEVVMKELAEAKAKADAAEDTLDEKKAEYLRLAADFENYRRRSAGDMLKQDAKATAKVCKELVGVLDNFERAIAAVDAKTDAEAAIDKSYQAINSQLLASLAKLDVVAVEAVGEEFNPELHDAIQRAESDEYAEGVVCTQFQRGYTIGETLIRPAMVVVSAGPGPAGGDGAAEGKEGGEGTEAADAAEGAKDAGADSSTEPDAVEVDATNVAEK